MAAAPQPVSQVLDLPLDSLRTALEGIAQRPFRRSRGEYLARTFNPAKLGLPVVNRVDGLCWVVDGQHRLYAYRRQPGVTGETLVVCEVYENLTQAHMADLFLGRNDTNAVTSFDRFYVACAAGYQRESAVRAVLDKLELRVSRSPNAGSISAVGAMMRVHDRAGLEFLERSLLVLRNAYAGDPEAFPGAPLRASPSFSSVTPSWTAPCSSMHSSSTRTAFTPSSAARTPTASVSGVRCPIALLLPSWTPITRIRRSALASTGFRAGGSPEPPFRSPPICWLRFACALPKPGRGPVSVWADSEPARPRG